MNYLEIEKVIGREIMDSRGNPTVEAEVTLIAGTEEEEQHQAARLQVNLRHWNSATATKQDISEKVF